MCVSHKYKSPLTQKPRHGAQGGVLRHSPLCSVFIILLTFILFTFMIPTKTHAASFNFTVQWGVPAISDRYIWQTTGNDISSLYKDYNFVYWSRTHNGKYTLYLANINTNYGLILQNDNGRYYYMYNGTKATLNYQYVSDNVYYRLSSNASQTITEDTYVVIMPPGVNFPGMTVPTPTPSPTPIPDYYNGFGDQDTPKGLKGWLKDLWSFLTDPEDYGIIQVGEGDTLVYSTPTPQPTPTPYIQQQQIINPNTGEVVYNIETNIENSTSQVYPTDYVWLDDVPDTVPHEFDLNFSVSGTPTEYTTDLNFSEASDAFIDTVSGVSDGVNALGSLLGAMPIEIIIYPIVAFCIWAIFAFIHRLLG